MNVHAGTYELVFYLEFQFGQIELVIWVSSRVSTPSFISNGGHEDHFILANGDEMNSDDDERSERDEMDDSGEDSDNDDDDDNDNDDDNDDDDSSLGSDDEEIKDEIVEKFILTFSNGDYDIEFDNALCID